MSVISVRLPKDVARKLDALVRQQKRRVPLGTSRSSVVRDLILAAPPPVKHDARKP